MSEIDDAKEWASRCIQKPGSVTIRAPSFTTIEAPESKAVDAKEKEESPGRISQYALYRNGYKPTTQTIKSLSSGIYSISLDQNGYYVAPNPPPTGLLLELPEMRSEEVLRIIETFWDSEKDYKEGNDFVVGGAAFKAGVMVYGPPGSGKTCTIKIVAKKMIERGGTVFYSGTHPGAILDFLIDYAEIEGERKTLVVMEDLDSLISNYGESHYLELLDGARTIDNVLFIATTNYPERLDPRIYNRPGRFSHVIKIGYPTKAAREAYLKAIIKNHRDVDFIVENSAGFSIDHLTALVNAVYREKKNLNTEIERLRTLFNVPKSEEKSLGFAAVGLE
jgi:Cdc6-like AAA superfamily ATPase